MSKIADFAAAHAVTEPEQIQVESVIFRSDLYPRIETSATTVQKYAEDLDVLPPVEVNQNKELIDGWHRWTAHKKAGAATIQAVITRTKSDGELLELAIARNASHGLQLSQDDKKDMATRIYNATPDREKDDTKARLARVLSVSERTIRDWLSRTDKDRKERRDKRIFDLWLACWTNEAIGAELGCDEKTVRDVIGETAELPKLRKSEIAAAEHSTDFDPPIYNIWKQQDKSSGSSHFGNTEIRWLDNLLYLYTKPFDIVIDPFAGGGSTIDLCKRRFRRYFVSDRLPIVEREKDIRKHDLVMEGLPKPPQWKDVRLVYLDPPYWKQAENQYSTDAYDLANMSLEEFTDALVGIVNGFAKKLTGGHIAVIISPTQWKAPQRKFTDHLADLIKAVKLPIDMRFSVPYESQQYNGQMVDWAKDQKRCLVLTREIIVWRTA